MLSADLQEHLPAAQEEALLLAPLLNAPLLGKGA
jgi:hypothetical protein